MTRFEVYGDGGVGLILPTGDLDTPEVKEFRKYLGWATEYAAIPATLLVDEGDVTFVGSAAVGAMIREHRRLKSLGGSFALAGRDGATARALRASHPRAPAPFPVFDNVEEAVQALRRLIPARAPGR